MPFRNPRRHLEDVLDAIDKITEFVGAMDLNAYKADEKTKAAVERRGIGEWAIYFGIPIIVSTTA